MAGKRTMKSSEQKSKKKKIKKQPEKLESKPSTSGINEKKRKFEELEHTNIKKTKTSTALVRNEEIDTNKNDDKDITPISTLNPFQSRWKIKARVVSKKQHILEAPETCTNMHKMH